MAAHRTSDDIPVLPFMVAIACHAVAAVPMQALGRRLGLPYRAPRPFLALLVGVGSAVVGMVASAAGVVMANAVATAGGDAPDLTRSMRPLRTAVLGAVPVLGPIVTAVAEIRTAHRLAAGRGGGGWPALGRVAAGALWLAGMRLLAQRGLRAALARRTPAAPPPPQPLTQLNVHPVTAGTEGTPDTAPGEVPGAVPGVADDGPAGYVVYFDGVGRVITRTTPAGRAFAAAIGRRLPQWAIVMSLMPNDVTQRPAWRRPVTGRLWRRLMRRDPAWLIGRGVWEAVVALDPRYRDRITADNTTTILTHLAAAGYRSGSGTPLVFVGLSAGAQTGLRCASDVARALGAPLDVVCLGGFCDGAVDLSAVRRVHAAVSWGDPAAMAPVLFFPSRWTAFGVGAWSRARRTRVVVVHRHDWATHVGRTGYLGDAPVGDGRSRLEQAADLVARAARELHEQCDGGHLSRRLTRGVA